MAEVTKKKSSKGPFSKLFAKTDIPLKVSSKSGNSVKGKNIMFTSGRKTWKEKEEKPRDKEPDRLNFQLPGPGRVKERVSMFPNTPRMLKNPTNQFLLQDQRITLQSKYIMTLKDLMNYISLVEI